MAIQVTPAIGASQIVDIIPSVLSGGGTAFTLNGLMLTANPRVPLGTLQSFPTPLSVSQYFGATSQEYSFAQIYFLGFNTSTKKPGTLLMSGYPWLQPAQAWLLGGSVAALSLAQLQALSGTIGITINGTPVTNTVNLNTATSFSNAASIIGSTLGITGLSQGSYVGSIAGTTLTIGTVTNGPQQASFVGSIAGGTLTVTSLVSGNIAVGQLLIGSGVTVGSTVTALLAGVGGVGTYSVSTNQTAGSESIVSYVNAGTLAVGDVVGGTGVAGNPYITALISGTGGLGTYTLSTSQSTANGTITAFLPGVTYDSLSGGFQVWSSTNGAASTLTYGTGALALSLNLTLAGDGVLSQGAAQYTPAGAMDAIVVLSTDWAQFMTLFEPVATDKEAFASWNNGQNTSYAYSMWDTSVVNTAAGGPSPAVLNINTNDYSGTSMIYSNPAVDTVGGEVAAFVLGYGASINFDTFQGRATAAFKSQTGLAPQVFNTSVYKYLLSYGMNCYGSFTTAAEAFTFYSDGTVSGPFNWLDSYLDAIWLKNALQLALMSLLTQVNSIPYNTYGYGLIQAACEDPIQAAVFAGVIQPGVPLSNAQVAEVFALSGNVLVAPVVSTRGWFLQITPATSVVRQARGSPPILLLYTDGESIQSINLASVLIE